MLNKCILRSAMDLRKGKHKLRCYMVILMKPDCIFILSKNVKKICNGGRFKTPKIRCYRCPTQL